MTFDTRCCSARSGSNLTKVDKKAAEPGATDNPDDAQRVREDYRVRISPAGCLSFIVGQGMKHLIFICVLTLALSAVARGQTVDTRSDVFDPTKVVSVGTDEDEVVALMQSRCVAYGRMTYGGTGAGRLYFQVGEDREFAVELSGGPKSVVTAVGRLRPLTTWTRLPHDGIWVEADYHVLTPDEQRELSKVIEEEEKAAQPGATDNPGDAQRLREDH